MPNVAPARRANARARSSAAPREAPTMTASENWGRVSRKYVAAARREAAEVDRTTRSMLFHLLPDAVPEVRATTAHAVERRDFSRSALRDAQELKHGSYRNGGPSSA